ncbi:MAG: 50S ribosomal protein L22 [Desulfohalobiaceae bacterium]|nr:50S ribosomal protein L22 [Desulfohalobiaceae bacterium]
MEVYAKARFVRISPRKTRLVAANIKKQPVEEALNILKFTPQKAAKELYKVLYAAVANAEHTSSLDVDSLFVKNVLVDEGPVMKRIKPRAMGRATRILKRTSHLTVIVDEI